MSRETEIVTLLATDTTLGALAPGGVYAQSGLTVAGITDSAETPEVYLDGDLQPTVIVKQVGSVPTGDIIDLKEKVMSTRQRVEIYVYASTAASIEAIDNRIYNLLMGHPLDHAWPTEPVNLDMPIMPAPELPSGSKMRRHDWLIRDIRRPSV